MRLEEANLRLGDIDLGGFDAESDTRLAEYFVYTEAAKNLTTGRETLFLGRKGSGKSSLFREIGQIVASEGMRDTIIAQITTDQYAWLALKEYQEQGLLPEQAHQNAWRLTLIVEAAAAIAAAKHNWSPSASEAVERLKRFLQDNFGQTQPASLTAAVGFLKSLKSVNLSAFGFGVGLDRDSQERVSPNAPHVRRAMLDALKPALAEAGVVIALDRLDESWDGSAESANMIIGLLKAAKELNNELPMRAGSGLRILVFLRTDIYDSLRFDDKDKHRPTERLITWTPAELRQMLGRRLPDGIGVDDLFEPGDMRGSIAPFNYIVKRTFLRPREVLQFVDQCVRIAGSGATQISKDDIRAAEARYSGWKVDDLKQEFRNAQPYFEVSLEALRQGVHRYDSLSQLSEQLKKKAPEAVAALGERGILEMLFEASVIGVRVGNAGSARFRSEDSYIALPSSGGVYVHQSLYRGLNITEARATGD